MNEKIKLLALQAKEYASSFAYAQAIGQSGYEEKFSEKFAELIVKECVDICINYGRTLYGSELIGESINRHFGVK